MLVLGMALLLFSREDRGELMRAAGKKRRLSYPVELPGRELISLVAYDIFQFLDFIDFENCIHNLMHVKEIRDSC